MASTYLELTNMAITQAGADLEQLTSTNFASPPDAYHVKFKDWVNQAWKEIQLERGWKFSIQQNVEFIRTGGIRTDYDAANAAQIVTPRFLKGVTSGTIGQVGSYTQLPTTADFSGFGGQGNALLTIISADGLFQLGEEITVYDGAATYNTVQDDTATPAFAGGLVYKGLPSYNYMSAKTYPNSVDTDEVYLYEAFTASGTNGRVLENRRKLRYLDYADFRELLPQEVTSYVYDTPKYFTYSPDGLVEFYPMIPYTTEFYNSALVSPWRLEYNSERTVQTLDLYTDVPTRIPAEYRDIVAWRAVMYYADDDSKPDKFRTSRRRYEFYKRRLEEELIDLPKWEPNPYYPSIGGGKR
jgi:hypothetical protein